MQQRKIIDLKVENIFDQSEHPRHTIMLTYDDASKKKILLYGNELSRILNKNFESVHLKEIFINGEFHGQFKLEAYVENYFGGYRLHREILDLNDVIALFNERGHLIDLDNKKNLLDLYDDYKPTPQPPKNNGIEEKKELKTISYDPKKYMLGPLYNKKNEPTYHAIEINCHADADGPYIAYRLFGMEKKETLGIIRQEDIPDQSLPHSVNDVMDDQANQKKWLALILDVTTKRGQTNADHIPPRLEVFSSPCVRPKGVVRYDKDLEMHVYDNSISAHLKEAGLSVARKVTDPLLPPPAVYYDKDSMLYYIDDSWSAHLKRVGLFAAKTATVALVSYAAYQSLKKI